jgi:hypothetical protein
VDAERKTAAYLMFASVVAKNIESSYDQWSSERDEGLPRVHSPTQRRDDDRAGNANNVREHSQELFLRSCSSGVHSADDCRQKERDAKYGNIIEQKDARCRQSDGVGEAALQLRTIDLVEQYCLVETLRLDSVDCNFFLVFRHPARGFGAISHGDESNESEAHCDGAFDSEDPATCKSTSHITATFAYICHPCKEPKDFILRIPEAMRPPKAPERGAIVIHNPRRKVNSERLYQRLR